MNSGTPCTSSICTRGVSLTYCWVRSCIRVPSAPPRIDQKSSVAGSFGPPGAPESRPAPPHDAPRPPPSPPAPPPARRPACGWRSRRLRSVCSPTRCCPRCRSLLWRSPSRALRCPCAPAPRHHPPRRRLAIAGPPHGTSAWHPGQPERARDGRERMEGVSCARDDRYQTQARSGSDVPHRPRARPRPAARPARRGGGRAERHGAPGGVPGLRQVPPGVGAARRLQHGHPGPRRRAHHPGGHRAGGRPPAGRAGRRRGAPRRRWTPCC